MASLVKGFRAWAWTWTAQTATPSTKATSSAMDLRKFRPDDMLMFSPFASPRKSTLFENQQWVVPRC
jgi:hypothetical protein